MVEVKEKAKKIKTGEYSYRGYILKKEDRRVYRNGYSAWNGWKLVPMWSIYKDKEKIEISETLKIAKWSVDYMINRRNKA